MALLQSRQVLCSTSSECRAKACAFRSDQRARNVAVRAARQSDSAVADRRSVLGGLAALVAAPALFEQRAALADEAPAGEYSTFLGMATPPTSYGGYGGNAKETPKYTFEYPTGWKAEVPSKVEKGTQGVDGRVVSPRGKDQQRAFVITLGRAGEDGKSFKLNDLDSTFAGFAGADYKILDALSSATNIVKSQRTEGDITFYEFDIDSPEFRYLSSIAVKQGKVFALFVSSPSRSFKTSEPKLRHILETFRLL